MSLRLKTITQYDSNINPQMYLLFFFKSLAKFTPKKQLNNNYLFPTNPSPFGGGLGEEATVFIELQTKSIIAKLIKTNRQTYN